MDSQTTYIVIGVLFSIYLVITIMNRRKAKKRGSRKFMEGFKRENNKEEK